MQCPYFHILEYGVFDSNVKFPRVITTQVRPVEVFELEYYVSDCPGESFIDGKNYPLLGGVFICAKPGQHRQSRLPFKCHYVHLQTDDEDLLQLLRGLPDCFMPGRLQELTQLFHEILTVESAELPEDRLFLESCICKLIWLVHRLKHTEVDTQRGNIFAHQEILQNTEKYIREHLSEELDLAVLSAHCNLSPTYFHRLFTTFFNKTPAQYVLDCRIAAAKAGLLTSNYSLSQLAADCGFSSQAYFCYKFKQITGLTPLQYRKDMLSRMKI